MRPDDEGTRGEAAAIQLAAEASPPKDAAPREAQLPKDSPPKATSTKDPLPKSTSPKETPKEGKAEADAGEVDSSKDEGDS